MLMLHARPARDIPAGLPPLARPVRMAEAVEPNTFDPTDMRCWLSRGRSTEQASELARIWRTYPDLPPAALPEARMARSRERIIAMRPLNDAISAKVEAERQARNFEFIASRAAQGTICDNEAAILRGRDFHGYDWDIAAAYASGWTAADAGWEHRFHAHGTGRHP